MSNVSEIFWSQWIKAMVQTVIDNGQINLSELDEMIFDLGKNIEEIFNEIWAIPRSLDLDNTILSGGVIEKYPDNPLVILKREQIQNNIKFQNMLIEKIRLEGYKTTILYFKYLLSDLLFFNENKEQRLLYFFDMITPTYRNILETVSANQSIIIHAIASSDWVNLQQLESKTWIKTNSLSPLLWRLIESQIILKSDHYYRINTNLLPMFSEWYQWRYPDRRYKKNY